MRVKTLPIIPLILSALFFLVSPVFSEIKRMLIADEGNEAVHYVNLDNPAENWTANKDNRDMQLIGNGQVLVSISSGYYVLDISNGNVVHEKGGYSNVETARRLPNGHTWLGTNGRMIELDENDEEIRRVNFNGLSALRLMRLSPEGTFLRGSGGNIIEGDENGDVIWQTNVGGDVYQVCRLANGNYMAATGYDAKIVVVNSDKDIVLEIPSSPSTGDTIQPHFYGGFQVLENGNVVATNWQNHGGGQGGKGRQVIEYNSQGQLVWAWHQDPSFVSSIHGIIVLDGLNTDYLHMQYDGTLKPVVDASLSLTAPNGAEQWEAGSQQEITWQSEGDIETVLLEYKSGDSWEPIDSTAANNGSYMWTVPGTASSSVQVRVSALEGVVSDISDGTFTITASTGLSHEKRTFSTIIMKNTPYYFDQPVKGLQIYDLAGNLLKEIEASDRILSWDGKNRLGNPLAEAVYIVRVQHKNTATSFHFFLLK